MKDQVINLVVAMNRISSVFGLESLVSEVCQHLIAVWYLANGLLCIYILNFSLCFTDDGERLDLTIIETAGSSEILQPNILGVDSVQFSQCSNSIVPPTSLSASVPSISTCAHISVLSAGVTSGIVGSSIILPSRNSII